MFHTNSFVRFVFQQLATLLIARQVIGNLKESAIPYMLEQLRLAKMSFDLFGALSPSEAKKELPGNQTEEPNETSSINKPTGTSRSISQAELESSLFKVTKCMRDVDAPF